MGPYITEMKATDSKGEWQREDKILLHHEGLMSLQWKQLHPLRHEKGGNTTGGREMAISHEPKNELGTGRDGLNKYEGLESSET